MPEPAAAEPGETGRWWTRPAVVVLALVLVSLVFNGYYLSGGFQADDLIFLEMIERDPLPYSRALGMWAADEFPTLTGLWFFEGEGMKAFFRPLPSLIFEGSVRLLGERAFPLHMLSIVLHGLVAGLLFLLVRQLTRKPALSLLAGLFFLSCEDHSMTVGVITMMTDPLCVLFVLLALIAHARWLETRRPWLLAAALAALWPAFLSKESAVLAPVAMALMTLLLPSGRDQPLETSGNSRSRAALRLRLGSFFEDWLSWAPALAMMVAYLVLYRSLGFGGLNSGMYVDPIAHPLRYLGHLVGHLPVMWLATLSPLPPSLPWFTPELMLPFAVAGLVLFVAWMVALWPLRTSLVAWALALYLVALLPQMAADASERALYFPSVAASILLAVLVGRVGPVSRLLASWHRPARGATPDLPPTPRFTRIAGWVVLVWVLIPGILLSAGYPFSYLPSFRRPERDALSVLPEIERRNPTHLVVINTPGWFHGLYLPAVIEHHLGHPIDVRVLSSMNAVVSLERIGVRAFVIHADRAGFLTNPFASMLRPPGPPRQGRVYSRDLFVVSLEEMTHDQKDVSAVRFQMHLPLTDPSLLFVVWDGEDYRPLDFESIAVGERIELADTSDVWASMM